jgi:putative transposase
MVIKVHEANIHDSKGAVPTIEDFAYKFPRLCKILADGGYQGDLVKLVKEKFGWDLEVVLKPKESSKRFNVIPKRWIV